MNILVIATHPDDEVLGCGGVISRHAFLGDIVHVLIVTRGIPELYPDEEILKTRQEMSAAHKILKIKDVHFLDFPAPKLDTIPGYELADRIKSVVHLIQPSIVYLPHRGDIHGDHRAVYNATLVAARPVNNSPPSRLLCYETLSETEWAPPFRDEVFIPTVFINITQFLDSKLQAMACYKSQLREPPHPRSLDAMTALAKWRGSTVNMNAAEAFMLVREIVD